MQSSSLTSKSPSAISHHENVAEAMHGISGFISSGQQDRNSMYGSLNHQARLEGHVRIRSQYHKIPSKSSRNNHINPTDQEQFGAITDPEDENCLRMLVVYLFGCCRSLPDEDMDSYPLHIDTPSIPNHRSASAQPSSAPMTSPLVANEHLRGLITSVSNDVSKPLTYEISTQPLSSFTRQNSHLRRRFPNHLSKLYIPPHESDASDGVFHEEGGNFPPSGVSIARKSSVLIPAYAQRRGCHVSSLSSSTPAVTQATTSPESGLGLDSVPVSTHTPTPSSSTISSMFRRRLSCSTPSSSTRMQTPLLCVEETVLDVPTPCDPRSNKFRFVEIPPFADLSLVQGYSRHSSMESLLITGAGEPPQHVLERSSDSFLVNNRAGIGEKICCVIDLDETLVHSSFQPLATYDFTVTIELDGLYFPVYVCKRPHLDDFLQVVSKLFECVLFTASVSKYADPVIDHLDPNHTIFQHRLFREACHNLQGNFVKNLDDLGRPLKRTVILDNSPVCYYFHAKNAIPISSWFDDPNDHVLRDLIPFFKKLARCDDVIMFLEQHTPPSVDHISDADREYITALGGTFFTRLTEIVA